VPASSITDPRSSAAIRNGGPEGVDDMNAYAAELLARDHVATMRQEAHQDRLTRAAGGARTRRAAVPGRGNGQLLPHQPASGFIRRVKAMLQGTTGTVRA
jgi:hypothetical protein